ncbi:MAG: hypothetical protein ACJ74U_19700 [Jatrophihabitantaceae bacterium]
MIRRPRLPRLGSAGLVAKLVALTVALLAVAGVAYAAASGNSAANTAKPGLTLQVAPASQTVTRGQSVTYTVSVTPTNGFTGTVALTSAGLPAGASGAFSPTSLAISTTSAATSTLTVAASSTATLGSSSFTITGTSGKVDGSVSATLSVSAALTSSLALSATPSTVTMAPGATAVYTVALTRQNFTDPVTLAVFGGLPAGATATFSPNPAAGNSATVQVTTPATANDGTYPLTFVGSGHNASGQTVSAYASVQLVLQTSGKPFSISGNLTGLLSPGASLPLDLALTNLNKKQISISNLTVTIQGVVRTQAAIAANKPCSISDYAVVQYTGGYPLTVAGSATAKLSQLNIAAAAFPHIMMRDTSSNQDGCKGAAVNLGYSGSGQGS